MNKPVLLTYATRLGSTAEVASRIAEVLHQLHVPAELCNVHDVGRLDRYSAVIVGSAIRNGSWLPEAARFIGLHEWQLSHMPVACFTVCMTLHEDTPENRQTVQGYLEPLLQQYNHVHPVANGMFAGKVDYTWLSFVPRVMAHVGKIPQGDWRDWDAIEAWVREIVPLLGVNEPQPTSPKQ